MEEPASWKSHGFTLLVFAGIVVLCSIFFILGMLVGRDQGQRMAEMATAGASNRKPADDSQAAGPELTFLRHSTEEAPEAALEPPPAPAPEAPPAEADPAPEPPAERKTHLQIFASRDSRAANRELERVKSKGFKALVLAPVPGDQDSLYRVYVGPYDSLAEADLARRELQAAGYTDVLNK